MSPRDQATEHGHPAHDSHIRASTSHPPQATEHGRPTQEPESTLEPDYHTRAALLHSPQVTEQDKKRQHSTTLPTLAIPSVSPIAPLSPTAHLDSNVQVSTSSAQSTALMSHLPQSQATSEADTFILFPKLPPELRVQIWKYTLPEPSTFHVICCAHRVPNHNIFFETFPSLPGPPPKLVLRTSLLRACSESREVYLNAYPYALPYAVQQNKTEFDRDWHDDLNPIPIYKYGQLSFGPSDSLQFSEYAMEMLSKVTRDSNAIRGIYEQSWTKDVKGISITANLFCRDDGYLLFAFFQNIERFEILAVDPYRGAVARKSIERGWERGLKKTAIKIGSKVPELILTGF